MKKNLRILLLLFLVSACTPTPSPTGMNLDQAVAAFLTSQPQPTSQPTYTPYPTHTPDAPLLNGLFCEYQFCIGHPNDVVLFDVRESTEPSLYTDGILAGYRIPDYYSLLVWQSSNGADDPQFMFDIVLDENDTRVGNLDVNMVGDLTAFYTAIGNTSAIASGGAATWICGNRAFGWKVYAESEELAYNFFQEALAKFRCNP